MVVEVLVLVLLLDEPDILSFLAIAAAAVRCPNSALSAGCEWALARTVLVAVQVMSTAAVEAIIRRMLILPIRGGNHRGVGSTNRAVDWARENRISVVSAPV